MKLTFISAGFFPEEHAAAIRQSLLSKGLAEHGHQVTFLALEPQHWNGATTLDYCGVKFIELNHYRGNNKLLVHLHYLKALRQAKKIIRNQKKEHQVDAIVVFSIMAIHNFSLYFLLKQLKRMQLKVYHERTELPHAFDVNKTVLDFYLNKVLPMFDGVFVISDTLNTYIKKFNPQTKKLLTVADLSFFSSTKASPYPYPYIGYCGTISGTKDGVPILIEAFAKIAKRFPALQLVLVGNNSNKDAIRDTLDAIAEFNITNRVVFTGHVDREMMPVILCNAEILVVSKPNNVQNSGNFPIKIGEYLSTGVPIVVTNVGEIPLFIKDGENGFLAEPDSADAFAAKMEEALSNPVKSKSIGQAGKKLAQQSFDYKIQAGIMADYMAAQNKLS